jgi:predicted SprT family Zn-dependent metalloprotease
MRFESKPKPPPEDPLGGYEYHCGGCVTSFFNEKGHQMIQRDGAWCEHCEGELILVWQPGDPL